MTIDNNLGLPSQGVPVIDIKTGLVSRVWWPFFQNLYNRVGGAYAPSVTQINNQINNNLAIVPPPEYDNADGTSDVIPGPQGPMGMQGVQGIQGIPGEDGAVADDSFIQHGISSNPIFNTVNVLGNANVGGTVTGSSFASTVGIGTAPLTITSTTNVPNLNASSLNGATFSSPGPVGDTIAGTGAFTALSASSTISGVGFTSYLASPPAIGGTVAANGTFSTLVSNGTFSGPGSASGPCYAFAGTFFTDGLYGASPGVGFTVGGVSVGVVTSTGLNSMAVGKTTPSTVAATTLTITNPSNVSASIPTVASAGTIAITSPIAFVSGVVAIATITPPAGLTNGGQITLIPTGIFTTTVAGNIALASTAVVSKALIMTYAASTSKWYPSY
jgi:hypothetical protein